MTGHPPARWLFLSISIATALACVRLGFWQLARLAGRRAENAVTEGARAQPPAILPGALAPRAEGRLRATGAFDLEHQFVLRGRAHDGAPGVEVATPLRLPGVDTALLVVRGFVPSDNATSVDLAPLAEAGTRTIDGIAFALTSAPDSGAPMAREGATTWSHLDLAAIRRQLPYPVSALAVWQEKDRGTTGLPIRLGAPALSEGPHLNYALQWFAFAIIFGGGGIFYTFRTRDEG